MNPLAGPPLTYFSLTTSDHIAHLVLNRPQTMNSMDPTFWRELDDALTHLNKTAQARVLLISSTGKHFSAGMALDTFGADIAMDDQNPEGRAAIFDLLSNMQATFTKLETLRIPVSIPSSRPCACQSPAGRFRRTPASGWQRPCRFGARRLPAISRN